MLTPAEISKYYEDGQITSPKKLSAETVAELNEAMETFFARQPGIDQDYAANLIDQDEG